MVETKKWILYKHTSNFELLKAVALDIRNKCRSDISDTERYRMQERLSALNLYKTRNPKEKPLDSINHRINTLEYWMLGYEKKIEGKKKFLFSPLGNLFIRNIANQDKASKIFLTMLFAIQFQHPGSRTDREFQLYPFRLILKLLTERRLGFRLYNYEVELLIVFIQTIDKDSYERLINDILALRCFSDTKLTEILKSDEHTYVNTVYEWEYYTQRLLSQAGIITYTKGEKICKLMHPTKTNSNSSPTYRTSSRGFIELNEYLFPFTTLLLSKYSFCQTPLLLTDPHRLRDDVITRDI